MEYSGLELLHHLLPELGYQVFADTCNICIEYAFEIYCACLGFIAFLYVYYPFISRCGQVHRKLRRRAAAPAAHLKIMRRRIEFSK